MHWRENERRTSVDTLSILDKDELLSVTRWYLDQGQFGNALLYAKHLLSRGDAPIEAQRLAAKIYAQLGLFDHAKTAFKAFIEQSPDALTEIFQYGMVHYDSGNSEAAVTIWKDVLDKETTYPPALFYSALALANQDKANESLRYLDVLIKSAPSDNLYFERGRQLLKAIEQNKQSPVIEDTEDQRKLEKYKNSDDRIIN